MDFMTGLKRTDYCGTFTAEDCGREVVVAGWVQRQRDLGALTFVTEQVSFSWHLTTQQTRKFSTRLSQ